MRRAGELPPNSIRDGDLPKEVQSALSAVFGCGIKVIDLGKDVDEQTFIRAVTDNCSCVPGLSTLMTATVANTEKTIEPREEIRTYLFSRAELS